MRVHMYCQLLDHLEGIMDHGSTIGRSFGISSAMRQTMAQPITAGKAQA